MTRSLGLALFVLLTLSACDYSGTGTYDSPYDPPVEPPAVSTIVGTYTATTFIVTRHLQDPVDALAEGASLVLTIAADSTITGTLTAPISITGGPGTEASMVGQASVTGAIAHFTQAAVTFVGLADWTVGDHTLSVADVTVGTSRFTVTLTRPRE